MLLVIGIYHDGVNFEVVIDSEGLYIEELVELVLIEVAFLVLTVGLVYLLEDVED